MIAAILLTLLTGCLPGKTSGETNDSGNNGVVTDNAGATDSGTKGDTDSDTEIVPATNPSEGYNNYSTVKSDAYTRISDKTESYTDISFTVLMNMASIALVDMQLIPLTVFTGQDEAIIGSALSVMGMTNVDISSSGDTYTITYTDAEGTSITQTCEYDASSDQLASSVADGSGSEIMFFEYVNLGEAYVSQYYYYSETDGLYYVVTAYFNDSNIAAFGISTASSKPASILGGSGFSEEFVINDEMYMILKDDVLTVFENGTVTTH